jgi:hypothetical protein
MRHYLYQQAIRQFSTQNYNLNVAYINALKHYSQPSHLGAYVQGQVSSAFTHGLPIIEIFIKGGGHALVGYGLQTNSDGSFDVDVYDPDDPFQMVENGDAVSHGLKLFADQIHVGADGSWSYTGGLGSTWSGPARDMRVLPFASLSGAFNPLDEAKGYVSTRGPIVQAVDTEGKSLYGSSGNLVAPSQRPSDIDLLNPITESTLTAATASTGLLLDEPRRYTESIVAGTLYLTGGNIDGQITTTGGKVTLGADGESVALAPKKAGPGTLRLSEHGSTQTTIMVSGRFSGAIALDVGANATIKVAKSADLKVSVTRSGPSQPPQTFESQTMRLTSGQQLELGSLGRLDLTASRVRATLADRGHRRMVTLINRAPRPTVRITRASAKRGHDRTRVTVRLATSGARGGQVLVTVRGGEHTATTMEVAARSRVTVSLLLSAQRRGQRLRVWAVGLTRGGQAGRIATDTVPAR